MPLVVLGFKADASGILIDRQFWVTVFMYVDIPHLIQSSLLRRGERDRLIVIPLSFLRRLDSLKYTSFIALVSIGYLVIIVLAHFLKGDTIEYRGEIYYFQWSGAIQALSSFPVMVFAYTCHQNVSNLTFQIFEYICSYLSQSTDRCFRY